MGALMSSSSDGDSSSSASGVSSPSESSGAKAKRLKKEQKQKKKDKKKQKKRAKKKRKEAKRLRKRALKELKKEEKLAQKEDGRSKGDLSTPCEGNGYEARLPPPKRKRMQRSSSEASAEQGRKHKLPLRHVEFDWESLLDVCETAVWGIKDVNAIIEDDKIIVHYLDGQVVYDFEVFKSFKEIYEFF